MTPCCYCESPLSPPYDLGPDTGPIPYVFCSVKCAEAYVRAVSAMEAG